MKKEKKIKIFLGVTYLVIISCFLWVFFNNFSLSDFTSYDLIKNNVQYLNEIKEKNLYLISLCFFVFTIIWVLLLGFASPIYLVGGFIFGKWLGSILVLFSLTTGATLLYLIGNFIFKELIKEKFYFRFSHLIEKFKNNEFIYFIIYRAIGGIPFFVQNLLPILFSIKIKNYFFGSIIGLAPQLFIGASLGAGFNKIINENFSAPTFLEMIFMKDIYVPIIGFVILIILGIFLKKFFLKNNSGAPTQN